ncbi:hypothetical protein Q8791_30615 [Nocardiopsis sp. CT-R113]|uniref:Uncharacterized protein n=1 Tax=Nocardiopsis codii TaxID=3065942 RepID=A0ABU7KH75_9ACTN|nr:hypothetical protein [Nocardiopsis sp. CT-R113]MEE2041583.1 hypothetical protein [Nocardiopsis sp. CT-R113]
MSRQRQAPRASTGPRSRLPLLALALGAVASVLTGLALVLTVSLARLRPGARTPG